MPMNNVAVYVKDIDVQEEDGEADSGNIIKYREIKSIQSPKNIEKNEEKKEFLYEYPINETILC
jgi:hypothetical protein